MLKNLMIVVTQLTRGAAAENPASLQQFFFKEK